MRVLRMAEAQQVLDRAASAFNRWTGLSGADIKFVGALQEGRILSSLFGPGESARWVITGCIDQATGEAKKYTVSLDLAGSILVEDLLPCITDIFLRMCSSIENRRAVVKTFEEFQTEADRRTVENTPEVIPEAKPPRLALCVPLMNFAKEIQQELNDDAQKIKAELAWRLAQSIDSGVSYLQATFHALEHQLKEYRAAPDKKDDQFLNYLVSLGAAVMKLHDKVYTTHYEEA